MGSLSKLNVDYICITLVFTWRKQKLHFDIKGLSENGTELRAQRPTVIIQIHHTIN